jgi:uncharacterized MAPEG superfamily protein
MTTALWCLMIAAVLPIVCTGIAKWGFDGFDNRRPREWLAKQSGWRARANAAQANSWEALAIFTAAVLTAHLVEAPQPRVDLLALVFIAARVAYIACYVADQASLRSLVWLVGLGASFALFFAGA